MLITSIKNDKIKEIVKLKDKKYRDKNGLYFVEGKDMVDIAYDKGVILELYLLDGTEDFYDMDITYVSMDVMKKISDMESISNYFAVCRKVNNDKIGNRIIVLDGIQDPGNLGTIIRSAVAFNFDTVVLSKNTVDLYNPKTLRSTKGMIFDINIVVSDILEFIDLLDGYTIYGTDVVDGINVRDEDMSDKVVIIIGNEGNGISLPVKKKCDKFIYIDMNNMCESLNASVAASILMYEVNNK